MRLFVVSLLSLALFACSNGKESTGGSSDNLFSDVAADTKYLSIHDINGKPICNAKILIGNKVGDPFADNFLAANENGLVALPSSWKDSQTVTIEAPGYVRSTYFSQTAESHDYILVPKESDGRIEVAGFTHGYDNLSNDGWADFGLVVPALNRYELFTFHRSMVISPEIDLLTIMGNEVSVPSNVSIPRQKESYFVSVTLDKPYYRYYFRRTGEQPLYATHGRFPFKPVVQELRSGKTLFEVLNYFVFVSGNTETVNFVGEKVQKDMSINNVPFTGSRNIKSPSFDNNYEMIAISLQQSQSLFTPTDMKYFAPLETRTLTTLNNNDVPKLLAVLQPKGDLPIMGSEFIKQRVSISMGDFENNMTPIFLPLINKPVKENNTLKANLPAPNKDIAAGGIYSVISQVIPTTNQDGEYRTMLWQLYSSSWLGSLTLPEWPNDKLLDNTKHRWEISYLGTKNKTTDVAPMAGPALLEAATHATHNAVEF